MYLFFDTETTGLPKNWKASVTDLDNWPRMVQLACILCDNKGNKIEEIDFIIKPQGFTIPKATSDIHGITTERAIRDGKPLKTVLEKFSSYFDKIKYLVAHNVSFDEKIVGAELLRNKMPNLVTTRERICTMHGTTNYCAIEGPYGYKWPKLTELHYKLFETDFEGAHDASVDISMTAKCFWELRKRGVL